MKHKKTLSLKHKHHDFIFFKLGRVLYAAILKWSSFYLKQFYQKINKFVNYIFNFIFFYLINFSVRRLRTSHLVSGSNPPDYGVQCQKEVQVYMQRVSF